MVQRLQEGCLAGPLTWMEGCSGGMGLSCQFRAHKNTAGQCARLGLCSAYQGFTLARKKNLGLFLGVLMR